MNPRLGWAANVKSTPLAAQGALIVRQAISPAYLLAGALLAGGLGAAGGVCAGAAPVVWPGALLPRGVTSRIPGGAAGGDAGCAFCAVEVVLPVRIDELFNP
jgi:hypothetical protein